MPRAAAAIPLLDACARVEMIAAADTACHRPRRGHGGPPDNLGSAGDGAGAEHARQERPLPLMMPPGLIGYSKLSKILWLDGITDNPTEGTSPLEPTDLSVSLRIHW